MTLPHLACACLLAGAIGCIAPILPAAADEPAAAPALRDGSHDFDFNQGTWHTHIKRVPDPLAAPGAFVEMDGTVTVRKVWGGRAWLEEIEVDGPKGHWQGATLFLYNPQAHQWSQSFVDSESGQLNAPTVGEFNDGRGELYATDTFNGRSILVRGVWSDITPDAHRYSEYYSADGGRTWAAAFMASLTRLKI